MTMANLCLEAVHVHCTKNALLSPKQLEFLHTNYGHPIILATDITENNVWSVVLCKYNLMFSL